MMNWTDEMYGVPGVFDEVGNKVLTIDFKKQDFLTYSDLIRYFEDELNRMRGPVRSGFLIFDHIDWKRKEVVYKLCASKKVKNII